MAAAASRTDLEAAALPAAGPQLAAVDLHALAHPERPWPSPCRVCRGPGPASRTASSSASRRQLDA